VDMARGENIYEKLGMPNDSDEVNNPAMIAKLKAMGHDSILATADDTAARKRFNLGSEGAIGPSYHLIPLDLAAIKNKFSKSDTMEVIKKSLARIRDLLKSDDELEKGAMKRHPFNPEEAKDTHLASTLGRWQEGSKHTARQDIPRMEGNARTRALHKLSSQTKVKNVPGGGNYYLLHRGMGETEANIAVKDGKAIHAKVSSWTPRKDLAEKFAHEYTGDWRRGDESRGLVASAWVHENNIHSIPSQYGSYKEEGADRKPGRNQHAIEREVLVAPNHNSTLANDLVAPREVNDMAKPDLSTVNSRINYKAKDPELRRVSMDTLKDAAKNSRKPK